jgi:rubrerythrin
LKVVGVDVFSAGQFEPAPGSFRVFEHQEGGRYWRLVAHEGRLVGANLFGDAALAPALKEAIDKATSLREAIDLLGSFPGAARAFVLEPALETTRRITKPASKEAIMASVKGTRTEKNLLAAFAGESQARNRYTYAGKAARKAGFVQIAALFEETARNEAEHAKRFFRFLEGGMVEITAMYPAGVIGDTAANLEAAANGEHEEWSQLYPEFARVAREEGFPEVAAAFITIARAEKAHEERFRRLLANVREDKVFRKDQPVKWKCDNCGYVHEGLEAPEKCPACLHPRAHFEVLAENY